MINLIPHSAKKQVLREYWVRVLAVWMFLAGTACLLVASLMLPTYMLLSNKIGNLQASVDEKTAVVSSFDTNATALTDAMKTANLLMSSISNNVLFSRYEAELRAVAGNNISLSRVTFAREATSTLITIGGTATTRQELANFRDALEANVLFEAVILPISSLVKNEDVLFDMRLRGLATTTP